MAAIKVLAGPIAYVKYGTNYNVRTRVIIGQFMGLIILLQYKYEMAKWYQISNNIGEWSTSRDMI